MTIGRTPIVVAVDDSPWSWDNWCGPFHCMRQTGDIPFVVMTASGRRLALGMRLGDPRLLRDAIE